MFPKCAPKSAWIYHAYTLLVGVLLWTLAAVLRYLGVIESFSFPDVALSAALPLATLLVYCSCFQLMNQAYAVCKKAGVWFSNPHRHGAEEYWSVMILGISSIIIAHLINTTWTWSDTQTARYIQEYWFWLMFHLLGPAMLAIGLTMCVWIRHDHGILKDRFENAEHPVARYLAQSR